MKKLFTAFLAPLLSLLLLSCGGDGVSFNQVFEPTICDPTAAMDSLMAMVPPGGDLMVKEMDEDRDEETYRDVAYSLYSSAKMANEDPIWLNSKGTSSNFKKFREALAEAEYHGLSAHNYLKSEDSTYIEALSRLESQEKLSDAMAASFEFQTTLNFLRFNSDLLFGKYHTDSFFSHKEWSAHNDSSLNISESLELLDELNTGDKLVEALTPQHSFYKALVKEMRNLMNFAADSSGLELTISDSLKLGDSTAEIKQIAQKLYLRFGKDTSGLTGNFDTKLEQTVEEFQMSEFLKPTGIIKQSLVNRLNKPVDQKIAKLRKNLERWRWSSKDMGQGEYVFVNIPAFRLFYYQSDSIAMAMNCVVGKTVRKSPTIDAEMKNIVLNPTWTVPPTILKKDILPSIQRRGGYAVARRGLTAYDRRGRRVNPGRINSRNYKAFRYVQKPSYNNSLGTIKFNMPNRELVYIHDTNHRWGFNDKVRARSSGCVRVMHPRDMATLMLKDQNYARSDIDSVIKTKKTTQVSLGRKIMSHFIYFTAAPDTHGVVVYYPDIYKHDQVLEGYEF